METPFCPVMAFMVKQATQVFDLISPTPGVIHRMDDGKADLED